MEKFGSHWTDFHKIIFESFSKICRENQSFIKIWQEYWVLYMKTNIYIYIYIYIYHSDLRMKNVSDKSCRKNRNTHLMVNSFFFPKIVPLMRYSGKTWQGCWSHRWQYNGRYTLSVKMSDFTVWRHTWGKNWINCAVLTDNSAGLRTALSSSLSHRELLN